MDPSRRSFLKSGSALMAGIGIGAFVPFELLAANRKRVSASDRINIAAIGINGMGWSDLNALLKNPEVNLVALCDVDENVLQRRVAELAKAGIKVKTYIDYREVLDIKEIDAVLIATPDHWHCLIMTDACAAGKDVYCEKPIGRTIAECRVMEAAQKKYNRVVQVGQWQRSMQHFGDAVAFVQSGKLGRIRNVKAWAYQGWMKPIAVKADQPVPKGVHYDRWLGPSSERPFNPNRFHFNFRWFYDYAGGLMTDWGVHLIDYILLGMKATYPRSVTATGGKIGYPNDAEEWPDTMSTLYDFGDFVGIWEQAVGINGGPYHRDHGIAYIGNNGTLVLDRGGWEVIPEGDQMARIPYIKASDNGLDNHTKNFVEVIGSRKMEDLHCPVQAAALVAANCHMGNIAQLTNNKVFWDTHKDAFTDHKSNAYLYPQYHNHYKFPTI
jgi:predicted dehydrogenase